MKHIVKFFIGLICLIILVILYSRYIGTSGIKTIEKSIKVSNLSDDFYGIKIVHITDIHYGRTTFEKDLKDLVKKINLTKPDIVVFTGDLFTNIKIDSKEYDKISSILNEIEASIGKYSIIGDNDLDIYTTIMANAGFKDISNTYELIYTKSSNYIMLSGISSNIKDKTDILEKMKSSNDFLINNKPNYSILLMHEADYIDKIDYSKYNLVLAGHSLNGQIRLTVIGGIIKQDGARKYLESEYELKNTKLIISNGIGTYNYSYRLFNRPSFNLYRIIK